MAPFRRGDGGAEDLPVRGVSLLFRDEKWMSQQISEKKEN